MTTNLRRYIPAFKNGNAAQQAVAISALCGIIETLQASTGVGDPAPASAASTVAPPQPAQFQVNGVDGKFIVFVTNPQSVVPLSVAIAQAQSGSNSANTPLIHHLQSATTLNFDQASNLKDYGTSSQLVWTDQDPNITRFFRLQSSYDGENWNEWQFFASAAQCGPVGVWSGLLRTAALCYLDSVAMTSDGSVAVSQDSATTIIEIAAKLWNVGTEQIAYDAGSVNPGAYGFYYIYAIDPEKAGGAVTYLATQNPGDLTAQDGTIQFGTITTLSGGGGSGGHGGYCCVRGVMVDMHDGTRKPAEQILKGDVLLSPDGQPEIAQEDAELMPAQPCFSFELTNSVKFGGASASELIRSNGHWVKLTDLAVGDLVDTRRGPGNVTTKTFLGERSVYRLRLDRTRRYYGDDVILHNMKIGP
jgi:hypothetical protein